MEVNKEEAARCRDIGASALRSNNYTRAIKMFTKSLHLYPLPGVKVLLEQAERKLKKEQEDGAGSDRASNGAANNTQSTTSSASSSNNNNNSNGATNNRNNSSSSNGFPTSRSSSSNMSGQSDNVSTGADGRTYTSAQVQIVTQVLKSRQGGRGAHYRVLQITQTAGESEIKKAYRKLALKLHPDKNSAPHSDEAFKAVGLAYATLSDDQKRRIYDMSGEEDPDNRGGGMRRGGGGGGGHMNFHGQDVSPEDIFNMFFGGGMPPGMGGGMGGPGFRVYSSGFGPGFGNMRAQQQQARARQQQQQRQQQPENILNQLLQFLPLLLIMALSFFSGSDSTSGATGNSHYYSLTPVSPHTNPLHTRLSKVKDIPYYVTDQFVRTIARDRYQLSQVERMVENSYQKYLESECRNQRIYKRKLELLAGKRSISEAEKVNLMKKANGFELSRCIEFEDLFPGSVREKDRVNRSTQQQQHHQQQQQRQHSEF